MAAEWRLWKCKGFCLRFLVAVFGCGFRRRFLIVVFDCEFRLRFLVVAVFDYGLSVVVFGYDF